LGKNDRDNILELVNIKKYFPIKRGFKQILRLDPPDYVKAVDDVSFQLKRGNVSVIAGESGSGKSTLARIILKAVQPDAGFIILNGEDITSKNDNKTMKKLHENVQMIQQDPYSSLNPRMRVMDIVMEPLNIHERKVSTRHERIEKVLSSLNDVRLHPADSIADQFPHMLSGGQRQRVALARALVLRPSLIIADEPVSMLDVSVRAEILQVIKSLKDRLRISCVYITHDLSTSRYIGDSIAIMYAGKIVEFGQVDKVLSRPLHPYTQALIDAIPQPFLGTRKEKFVPLKQGKTAAETGCKLYYRCPYSVNLCQEDPGFFEPEESHKVSCLMYSSSYKLSQEQFDEKND
jgi:peptide/nickel transport system ATP-binding protein